MYLLKDRFRCIAYDLPNGHNDGARLGRYRHAHLVDDLRALLDHLDLQQAFILGSSFGSTIALSAMRQMPERFPRGIVQGGFARRPLSLAERLLAWTIRFIPGPMAKFRPREKMLSRLHKPPFEAGPADRWRAFIDWTAQSRVSAVSYQIGMVHQVDLREQLAQIQQPILLVHGELDPVMPRPHAEMLLAGLPNATLAVIENCGHVPCYSHPEILANLICRFLAKPCPSPQECPGQRVSLPTT
jgi:pimeloyl-ACP methyl ester carboxylesterase